MEAGGVDSGRSEGRHWPRWDLGARAKIKIKMPIDDDLLLPWSLDAALELAVAAYW